MFQREKHDRRHAALRRSGGFTFEVRHTASELSELARLLKSLDGETRVVMEPQVITTRQWPGYSTMRALCLGSQCNAGA